MSNLTTHLTENNLGNRWTKNANLDRIYIHNHVIIAQIGLTTDRYNSGHISSASINGENISNASARQIIEGVTDAKLHYNVPTSEFRWNQPHYIRADERELIEAAIHEFIATVRAAA